MHIFILFFLVFIYQYIFLSAVLTAAILPPFTILFFLSAYSRSEVTYSPGWLSPCQMLHLGSLHFSRPHECNDPPDWSSFLLRTRVNHNI